MRFRRLPPLTPRGWVVVGLVIGSVVLAWLFGARSLNAVAAPAAVAVVAALWGVSRFDTPTVTRRLDSAGTEGDRVEVEVMVHDAGDRIGRITDHVPTPLEAIGNGRVVSLEDGLCYELELTDRGRYTIGPATVAGRDLLGLVEHRDAVPVKDTITVYPRAHPVSAPDLRRAADLANIRLGRERQEFDRLREYQPTDALRDVHWKTSAKRPDTAFIVKEFVTERDRGSVMLSGEAARGADDALAEALASLASAFLEYGVRVGVVTPDGKVAPVSRNTEFDRLLAHLATMGAGQPRAAAELHLVADSEDLDEVTLEIEDTELAFGELRRETPELGQSIPAPTRAHTSQEVAD